MSLIIIDICNDELLSAILDVGLALDLFAYCSSPQNLYLYYVIVDGMLHINRLTAAAARIPITHL